MTQPSDCTIVVVHPEWGIYLGGAMGLGFFSLLDAAEQPAACTFPNEEQARGYVASWESNNDPDLYRYVLVRTTDLYAYYDVLVGAGLAREAAPLMRKGTVQ